MVLPGWTLTADIRRWRTGSTPRHHQRRTSSERAAPNRCGSDVVQPHAGDESNEKMLDDHRYGDYDWPEKRIPDRAPVLFSVTRHPMVGCWEPTGDWSDCRAVRYRWKFTRINNPDE